MFLVVESLISLFAGGEREDPVVPSSGSLFDTRGIRRWTEQQGDGL